MFADIEEIRYFIERTSVSRLRAAWIIRCTFDRGFTTCRTASQSHNSSGISRKFVLPARSSVRRAKYQLPASPLNNATMIQTMSSVRYELWTGEGDKSADGTLDYETSHRRKFIDETTHRRTTNRRTSHRRDNSPIETTHRRDNSPIETTHRRDISSTDKLTLKLSCCC